MQLILLILTVGFVVAATIVVLIALRVRGSYGKGIETVLAMAAGLTGSVVFLVLVTDVSPDVLDQAVLNLLVPAITVVLIVGTALRIRRRSRIRRPHV